VSVAFLADLPLSKLPPSSQSMSQVVEAHRVVRRFLDNLLTDGGVTVSLTRRPPFTPRKIPGTNFYQRLSRPQGHSAAGRIRSIEKSNDIGN
jgi:hypothetical protein